MLIQVFVMLALAACGLGAAKACLAREREAEAKGQETSRLRWMYTKLIAVITTFVLVGLSWWAFIEWVFSRGTP